MQVRFNTSFLLDMGIRIEDGLWLAYKGQVETRLSQNGRYDSLPPNCLIYKKEWSSPSIAHFAVPFPVLGLEYLSPSSGLVHFFCFFHHKGSDLII